MAQLTTDAKWLGFTGQKILLRVDYVSASTLEYSQPGIELLLYHCDRYDNQIQTYGVYMGHAEAVDLLHRLDKALRDYDNRATNNGANNGT